MQIPSFLFVREFNKNALVELDFYKTTKEDQIREILRSYCLLQARIAKAVSSSSNPSPPFILLFIFPGFKKLD